MLIARAGIVVMWCAVAAACAGHGPAVKRCDPLNASYGMPVFPECAVDRAARLNGSLPPRIQYTPPSVRQTCLKAVIDVVIDEKGVPVPGTAKLVRTNDNGFATAAMAQLAGLRYEPARKDGVPVAQLVRVEPTMVMVRSTGSSPTQAQLRSASRTC